MDENYIGQLRQTIFSHKKSIDTENKGGGSGGRLSLECYKSENVFVAPSKHDLIKDTKDATDSKLKIEKRKAISESSDDSFVLGSKEKLQSKLTLKKKKTKKKKCMLTFSSDSDEEAMSLIPSRSETDSPYLTNSSEIQPCIKNDVHEISSDSDIEEEILVPQKKEIKPSLKTDVCEISSDSDSEDFNLDTFFCTRDQSITEPLNAHAEFDFISDYIKEVKISNKKIYDPHELKRYRRNSDQSTSKKNKKHKICKEEFDIEIQKDTKPDISSLGQNVTDHFENKNLKYDTRAAAPAKGDDIELHTYEKTDLYNDDDSPSIVDCIEIQDDDDEYVEHLEESTIDSEIVHDEAPNTSILQESMVQNTKTVPSTGFSALIQENKIYSEESSEDVEDPEKYFQSVYEVRKPKAAYYSLDDDKIVVLRENSTLPFFGLFKLKVLYGKIEILGCTLTEHSKAVNVYSPRGSAWLYIRNITDVTDSNLSNFLPFLESNECLREVVVEETSAVLRCSRSNDRKMRFVEKYISQHIFPDDISSKTPQVAFEPRTGNNVVITHKKWDEVISQIGSSTKFMVTGGRGVGKSMFVRYTINRLLGRFKKVRVVDLDPGQSMFTPPGMVSVLYVSEPVLGPSYTHLMQTERSYLSNIDVGRNPFVYVKSVKSLMDYIAILDNDVPTVINYMGFVQSLGLNIISSVITYVKPTDVVQINSKQKKKNFKESLSIQLIKENCKIFGHASIDFQFRLHELNAMNDASSGGWTLEPRQMRELCVLAYLAEMLPPNVNSLTSNQLPMYKVKLSSLKLMNMKCEELCCAEINGNLVALCDQEDNTNIFICYGYGVVRGIDTSSDCVVVMTPVNPEFLEKVLYLVQGDVALPPSVYMTPDEVIGKIPYVMQGELVSLGQITKRSYIPANKR
ncbi:unnamed protein product [Callosobruchus maculatus]|uniref:Polynucleotide 5'-hydroxyl-kinase NOL9 n=1 Tax=Callosobruchus maculatus TaxID=64391 RepID=A0A653C813_CALMS|nr:unnamed protein product [Callosobruchus maculatus]